ncbi:Hypothetical protein, putative [Bodo saltans]|uniref:Myosin motor domain-containing protein n=1 Tax=Bodo saltans TaxID=75058 RepID=A0A0S4IX18_BODSA|nr:Hypothetical protein, putative [Bodo saltans]|eukprot:CUF84730.1 Hypothetical protein, putative [Bodo saltans]
MSRVFYRSSTDGWRIGAADVTQTNKATVVDAITNLAETCRMSDIFVPAEDATALLNMSSHPEQFLAVDDVARMQPSPLAAVPSLVELARYRVHNGKYGVSVGDNVELIIHHFKNSPEYRSENCTSAASMAPKVIASLRASCKSQTVVGSGAVPAAFSASLCAALSSKARGPSLLTARISAAHTVASAFTNTVYNRRGELCVRRTAITFSADEQGSVGRPIAAIMQHYLLDLRHFGTLDGCEDNFCIFAMMIYAFNHEEKERVHLSRKQTDFQTQRVVKELDHIHECRKWYTDFNKALEVLGIEFSSRLTLYARMSAVLHLLEIDFFEDGSHSNLTAVKSVARLLQLDFNAASRIFASKDVCVAAARWLYEASFITLTDKINAALNAAGASRVQPTSPSEASSVGERQQEEPGAPRSALSVTVVSLPRPPSSSSSSSSSSSTDSGRLSVSDLSLSTLYEDVTQCFYRTTEVESIYWQRAGLTVPQVLQAFLDETDNFNLLRTIKGKNGVQQCAQLVASGSDEPSALGASKKTIEEHLLKLTKSRHIEVAPGDLTVTVPHCFGKRTYDFSPEVQRKRLDTIYVDRYAEMREFLFANADVETQEALYAYDQQRDMQSSVLAGHALQVKPIVELLQSSDNVFWWAKGAQLFAGFQGDVFEDQLKLNTLLPVMKLRQVLPRRYIPCHASFVVSAYASLLSPTEKQQYQQYLPGGNRVTQRDDNTTMLIAEAILTNADVSYLVTPEATMLIESSMIMKLQRVYQESLDKHASLIQAYARCHNANHLIRARFHAWKEAVNALDSHRATVVAQHKAQVQSAELHKLQRYELSEKEATDRIMVRDQYWVEWVALQTSSQQELQYLLQKMVAQAIRKEENSIKKAVSQSQRNAVEQLAYRIQQRLLSQGSHLDHVVEQKERAHANAYKRLEREMEAHKRLMTKKLEEEETKLELKQNLAVKQTRVLKVAVAREQQREELRQKIWAKQEKDRIAREQMERVRLAIASNVEEQIAFENIERQVARRVATEIETEQKQLRLEQAEVIRQAKKQRESQIISAAKRSEQLIVRQQQQQQRREEAEAVRRRKAERELLTQQERERRAFERIKREEEHQQKSLTRSLLKAHELLQTPAIFEHTTSGATQMMKMKSMAASSPGFTLINGKESHPRLLSTDVVAKLMGNASPATPGRSVRRVRDASPTSNFSL